MVCGHEGVLSWHAGEGTRWRPELMVWVYGKRSNAADALRLVDWLYAQKGKKKFCELHNLNMWAPEVYGGADVTGICTGSNDL